MKKGILFRLAAAVLSMAALLTGCARLYEDNDTEGLPAVPAYSHYNLVVPREIVATMYFLQEDGGLRSSERRFLALDPSVREEEVIVRELLNGPKTEGLKNAAKAKLSRIEVMDDVINVYLTGANDADDKEKYLLATQIADTLIEMEDIEFVCVLYDEVALNYEGYPIGALPKSDGDPAADYEKLVKRMNALRSRGGSVSIYVPLYFISSDLDQFIPETRRITMRGEFQRSDDFCNALLRSMVGAIADGPETKFYLSTYINGDYLSEGSYAIKYSDGEVSVNRSNGILYMGIDAECGALYYTVAGVLPVTKPVNVMEDGTVYHKLTFEAARQNAGSVIRVMLPDRQSGRLIEQKIEVKEKDAVLVSTNLDMLFNELSADVFYGKRINFKEDSINGIAYSGTMITLDLSKEFLSEVRNMSSDDIRLLMYSIVNTLCSTWITDVLILEDGKTPANIGGLDLEYPLMPDCGIVK